MLLLMSVIVQSLKINVLFLQGNVLHRQPPLLRDGAGEAVLQEAPLCCQNVAAQHQ